MDVGGSVTVAGSIQVNSCDNNDGINVHTSGSVTAAEINVVGADSVSCDARCTPAPNYDADVLADPFASRSIPTCSGCPHKSNPNCTAAGCYGVAGNYLIDPGIYDSGISIGDLGGKTVTFKSGTYILDNSLLVDPKTGGQVFSCGAAGAPGGCGSTAGVTFYYAGTSGNMRFASGSSTLAAPTTDTDGENEGMLFWQTKDNTNRFVVDSATTVNFSGVVYIPNALIDFTSDGSTTTAPYTIFVSKTLSLSTHTVFNSNVSSLTNGSPTSPGGGRVSIVE
jgi:hypothetical protein